MSNNMRIEHEATTALMVVDMLNESRGMQSFLTTLDDEQQRRFAEHAHHIAHTAFTAGLDRAVPKKLTDEQRGILLTHETNIFLEGVAYGMGFDDNDKKDKET